MARVLFRLVMATVTAALLGTLLAVGSAQAEPPRRKVIIDDEGFQLMHVMLLQAPQIEVLGLTTVSGNTWANRATAMALRGLELTHRPKVPVAQGATWPLLNTEAETERWEALYGKLTWKGAWMRQWVEPTQQVAPAYHGPDDPVDLPWGNPRLKPSPEIAANFLIRMVHRYPGQVTLVATGPLTNLALAQLLDPAFAGLVGELVIMGGSLDPRQVRTDAVSAQFAREYENSPRREFNIRFDPEAASIVARSPWRKVTLVPVDPSTATQLSPALIARLRAVASPDLAKWLDTLDAGLPMWDEIAAGVVLDPDLVTRADDLYVDFDTRFGPGYGDTLSWREGYQPRLGEQKMRVIRTIDAARLDALIARMVAAK